MRGTYLSEDLPFAGDHRVETGGDPKQMERRLFVAQPVESRAELRLEGEQRDLRLLFRSVGGFIREIQLCAVARREEHHLCEVLPLHERVERLGQRLARHRHPLQ